MKKNIIQFIKFGVVGGINTVLSLLIYWLGIYLGIHYLVASIIAFIITIIISYILNNLLTFRNTGDKVHWSFVTFIKVFVSYSITGMFLNNLLLYVEIDVIEISEVIAPIVNILITVPTNFILNKLWAYKKLK